MLWVVALITFGHHPWHSSVSTNIPTSTNTLSCQSKTLFWISQEDEVSPIVPGTRGNVSPHWESRSSFVAADGSGNCRFISLPYHLFHPTVFRFLLNRRISRVRHCAGGRAAASGDTEANRAERDTNGSHVAPSPGHRFRRPIGKHAGICAPPLKSCALIMCYRMMDFDPRFSRQQCPGTTTCTSGQASTRLLTRHCYRSYF